MQKVAGLPSAPDKNGTEQCERKVLNFKEGMQTKVIKVII